MTKPFKNVSKEGHELALRRGIVVPDGAVNLAYVKSPELTPEKNIVIVDTARIVEENLFDTRGRTQLYFANSLGVLEDQSGNQIVEDEYPIVTDVFAVDDNFFRTMGSRAIRLRLLPRSSTTPITLRLNQRTACTCMLTLMTTKIFI
jgi:hypothetical protein